MGTSTEGKYSKVERGHLIEGKDNQIEWVHLLKVNTIGLNGYIYWK